MVNWHSTIAAASNSIAPSWHQSNRRRASLGDANTSAQPSWSWPTIISFATMTVSMGSRPRSIVTQYDSIPPDATNNINTNNTSQRGNSYLAPPCRLLVDMADVQPALTAHGQHAHTTNRDVSLSRTRRHAANRTKSE
jgi:hypothetical protein